MSDDALPEADRNGSLPHPRETLELFGQAAAEEAFLAAARTGRMHHAWLITGPMGVGKATLAWRIARYVLSRSNATSLAIDIEDPIYRRTAALAEPRLALLRRAWDHERKRLKTVITVDEARKLKSFFALSAADGGWRVAIVDAADEMNTATANALLKSLEEPPDRTLFLLVAHQPGKLLPTIRSRCRTLACATLSPEDLSASLAQAGLEAPADPTALAQLSGGAPGQAAMLLDEGGTELYANLVKAFSRLPSLDRAAILPLAEACAGAQNASRYALTRRLIETFLARLARHGATGAAAPEAAPGEAELFARLAPSKRAAQGWATCVQTLAGRMAHGAAVNLDPTSVILDTALAIEKQAGQPT